MADYKVSLRYASSLLDLAIEKNILNTISKDADLITAAFKESPQLKNVLANPVVKPQVKISILEDIFKSRIDNESMNFLKFIIAKNRDNLLYSIYDKFLEIRDEYLGIVNVDVKTAFEFNDSQKDHLKDKLEGLLNKKVNFKFTLDASVIGGFIAKVGDTVFDASIKHQLENLKKQFLQGSASLN